MKRRFFILLGLIPILLMAQAPESHQKRYFQDTDGKLYWNRYLPFFLTISSSPDEKGILLESENQAEYTNPAYFDTEGQNFIRTRSAVDKQTMKAVTPALEIMWEVYADGLAPATKITLSGARKYQGKETVFYGKGLQAELKSSDGMSGVLNTYFTTNSENFSPYSSPILYNSEGNQFIKYYAADRVGNVEEVRTVNFNIDLSSPKTSIIIDGITKDYIVAKSTHFALKSTDNLSGISITHYRINDGDLLTYNGGYINKNHLPDGEHNLVFYSTDNVGNIEAENKHVFYLDKLPPIMAADALGDRYIAAGKTYFSGRTKLKLTSVDNKSGVKDVFYAINDKDFTTYNEPFYLPNQSGYHLIRYYSVDNMGNESYDNRTKRKFEQYEHNVQRVYVDLTGPTLNYQIKGPGFTKRDTQYVSPKSKIYISGADKESGLQYLSYSIDGKLKETTYTQPFSVQQNGKHTIEYFGYDNVNNRNKKQDHFIVDGNPPEIFHNFSVPSFAKNADGIPIFPSYVKLYIGATDLITGNEKLLISINGSSPSAYKGQVSGFKKDGAINEIKIIAEDKVGNQKTHIVQFIVE